MLCCGVLCCVVLCCVVLCCDVLCELCVNWQSDWEKQLARLDADLASARSEYQAATAALEKCRAETASLTASMDSMEKARAVALGDVEKLKSELASVREELSASKATGSGSSEQLRQKSEELMRVDAARATAEALCVELRSSMVDAKVCMML